MAFQKYNHKKVEKSWQKEWEKKKAFEAKDNSAKPKFYGLIEFPYPSGDGLHVGHVRSNTAMDIIARKRRAEGFEVLYPIGWDAFGLPTENYAIKTGVAPQIVTKKNTDTFRRQLKSMGFSFDWDREVNTTDPAYYKWTQWIFLEMFKKGLAYKKRMAINWCPKDKIGLANEEVIDGKCERCGTEVEQREKEQWMLAITKYADRLDKDLDTVDFLEKIKIQQRNWIGKSEGAEIGFEIVFSHGQKPGRILVFTTRPDTLFGVTYLVLSPEHPWVTLAIDDAHKGVLDNADEVKTYVELARKKDVKERTSADKEKTGVELKGVKAIHPISKEKIPVFVADYVLADYGTGAIMAVPAHDERDFAFAKKYNLPVKEVIAPLIHVSEGAYAFKPEKKTVSRKCILAIVKHWEKDEYLVLESKKHTWATFVIGGIDVNESAESAVRREIAEETGFVDIKAMKTLGGNVFARHFAPHKDENRYAELSGFFVELGSDKRDRIADHEINHQVSRWVKAEDIAKTLHPKITDWVFWQRHSGKGDALTEKGVLINSGEFSGIESSEAMKKITEKAGGKMVTTYKLRDWVFSRQRYWGEPIPLVYCSSCAKTSEGKENAGWIPVPEEKLPVKLPKVEKYQPTDTGESPLAAIEKWVKTKCPICGGNARRETDTMPNWAGSSWYYLRYVDPSNKTTFAETGKLTYWTPVDWYNGGMEHTTLHLLYSRFWHKFLFDQGLVPTAEPYKKRTSHGLILAEGGVKMSKSKGNVINPDSLVETVGADALRLYEMFMGPFDQPIAWSNDGVVGTRRFLDRIWRFGNELSDTKKGKTAPNRNVSEQVTSLLNATIKKVSADIEAMKFNTAVSSLMVLLNTLEKEQADKESFSVFLKLLSPFAPYMTEELWRKLGNKESIHVAPWPHFDETKMQVGRVQVVVQIDGKVRASFAPSEAENEEVLRREAEALSEVQKWLGGKTIKKVIIIKNKIVSFVLAP